MKSILKGIGAATVFLVLMVGIYTVYFNLTGPDVACQKQYVSESISPDKSLKLVQVRMPCTDGSVAHSIGIEYLEAGMFSPTEVSMPFLEEPLPDGSAVETPELKLVWLENREVLVQYPNQVMNQDSFEMGGVKFNLAPVRKHAP